MVGWTVASMAGTKAALMAARLVDTRAVDSVENSADLKAESMACSKDPVMAE